MAREVWEFDHGGRRRRALVRGPNGLPAAVLLPGTGATAEWADLETGWLAAASAAGFRAAIAEGTLPDPSRPHRFRDNPLRFDDGGPWNGPHHCDDVGYLTELLARLGGSPACVAGFSNGAGMAFRLAAERAESLAAVAPVAGLCWVSDPHPSRPVPTLYVIGERDPLVPPEGGTVPLPWGQTVTKPPASDTLRRWALALGMPSVPSAIRDEDGVRTEEYGGRLTACFVAGHGHHWPGGTGGMNPRLFGPAAGHFDANARLLAFFRSVQG